MYESRVRGTSRAADLNSDLDLLVDMEPGRGLLDLGGSGLNLNSLLGVRVDVLTENTLKRPRPGTEL